ncbi:hypothetical protein NIES267_55100 [Calothrix parasitica NIES-267]|uniref:Uncharacterized protein n=1 Tax=Calothrix parasitica NIES-267 TaxID=1973488 RepID=A0A1Z4LXQ1_9CYAN|nr:hypothetical protein NIES267_55100 [Calothrix parasitica NIES-267]
MSKQSNFSRWLSPSSSSRGVAQSQITPHDLNLTSKSYTANSWIPHFLPGWKTIGRFALWGIGRAGFSICLFGLDTTTNALTVAQTAVKWSRGSLSRLLTVYDQLPYGGTHSQNIIEAAAVEVSAEPEEIITDVIEAIQDKQVMIIGEMGTGKSTLAQYLAYSVGGRVKVYEPEGTPEDWQGLEVVGKGENWTAIEAGMQSDLEDLSSRIQRRMQEGGKFLEGSEQVVICEEYPELVNKVSCSGEWLDRHARRGRKARRFTVLLSQYDKVAAWGLEGKSDLSEAFFKIRLGKKALAHAKSLKNDELIYWLKQDRSHCLLDDNPCKLPPYREMKAVITRPLLNQNTPIEKSPEKPLKAPSEENFEEKFSESDAFLWRLILKYGEGKSDSTIVTEILGMTGKKYGEGKDLLERLRRQFG